MIEGLLGILVAIVIFVLVLFFYKREPNPSIAIPLNKYMTYQGFILIETSSPLLKPVNETFHVTQSKAYIEQAYFRSQDNTLVCWISKNTEADNNALISVVVQNIKTDPWMLVYLSSLQGGLGSFIRKLYQKMVISSGFSKLKLSTFGERDDEVDLYLKSGSVKPTFDYKFINILKQCGNMIIRSNGTFIVLERISVNLNETLEQEVREILRVTELMRGVI